MKRNSVQTSFAFSPESRYINLYNIVDQRQEPEKLQLNWEKLKPKKWNGFLNHSTEKESPGFEQLIQIDKSACGYFSRLTCWLLWYEREIKGYLNYIQNSRRRIPQGDDMKIVVNQVQDANIYRHSLLPKNHRDPANTLV